MDPLDAIRTQIEQGDVEGAMRALVVFVRDNPDSTAAWMLLSSIVSDPVQQADCYHRILDLDPGNQEAASALEGLREVLPQDEVSLRCPQCGGRTVVRLVGRLRDKRAICQHCGTEIDLVDSYQRVEHQHEQEHHFSHTRTVDRTVIETRSDGPGAGEHETRVQEALTDWWVNSRGAEGGSVRIVREGLTSVEDYSEEELERWLHDRGVLDVDQVIRQIRQLSEGEVLSVDQIGSDGHPRSILESLFGGQRTVITGRYSRPAQDDVSRPLSPDEIIEAAGGPLPPHERRKCPKCGATISVRAPRCEWCGTWFSEQDVAAEAAMSPQPTLQDRAKAVADRASRSRQGKDVAWRAGSRSRAVYREAEVVQPRDRAMRPSSRLWVRLKWSFVAGVMSVLAYSLVAGLAYLTGFRYPVTRLLALGPGVWVLNPMLPVAETAVAEMMSPLVTLINGIYYYAVGAVPGLVTRRVWILILIWTAMAFVGGMVAWLALAMNG